MGRGHEHGLGEAYGRRGGARCLYTPVCQVWSALLDHRAVRRVPAGGGNRDEILFRYTHSPKIIGHMISTYLRAWVHEQGVSSHAGFSRSHAEGRWQSQPQRRE